MLKTNLYAALLLTALAGCASQAPAQLVPVTATCPKPPAPPAWVMQAPSNSVEKLDKLFSISAEPSFPTKQP
ncbi:hypothetical protein D3M70_00335 [Pseudomonas sp. LS-2]|nr:hypothetical protein D3M70_00335 [Pseudomonas sp. LS-2]